MSSAMDADREEAYSDQPTTDSEGSASDSSENAINQAKQNLGKSKKRKRALSPETFGAQLSALVNESAPSAKAIASAHRPLHATSASIAAERRTAKQKLETKHQRLERGHIKDVIGGWNPRPACPFSEWARMSEEDVHKAEKIGGGQEGEKELRRLAQRGVVKLFNAIRAAQGTTADDVKTVEKTMRKTITDGKTPIVEESTTTKEVRQPNALGTKGKEQACGYFLCWSAFSEGWAVANLSKESFLQILKGQT